MCRCMKLILYLILFNIVDLLLSSLNYGKFTVHMVKPIMVNFLKYVSIKCGEFNAKELILLITAITHIGGHTAT